MLTRHFGTGATTNLQCRITERGKIRLAHHLLLQKILTGALIVAVAFAVALVHTIAT